MYIGDDDLIVHCMSDSQLALLSSLTAVKHTKPRFSRKLANTRYCSQSSDHKISSSTITSSDAADSRFSL